MTLDALDLARIALDELSQVIREVEPVALERLTGAVLAAPRVFTAGAGRSGLVMRAFAMRLMQAGLAAHAVGEPTTPAAARGDLLVVGSGSGETASLVAMARRARELGMELALVTIVSGSTIGRLASPVLAIGAPSPKVIPASGAAARTSTLPLGSLFEQALLLLLDVVALQVARARGEGEADLFGRHANLE